MLSLIFLASLSTNKTFGVACSVANSSDLTEVVDLERTLDLYDDFEEEEDMYDSDDTSFFNDEYVLPHFLLI